MALWVEEKPLPGYEPDFTDGAFLNYDKNGLKITIFLPGVRDNEIEAVKKGNISFYLNKIKSLIYLSLDFGTALKFDCSYSIHRVDEQRRQIPENPGPGKGFILPITLVDSETGIIKANRLTVLNTEFSLLFKELIVQQLKEAYSDDAYFEEIEEIENQYSPEKLRRSALSNYKTEAKD